MLPKMIYYELTVRKSGGGIFQTIPLGKKGTKILKTLKYT